MSFTLLAGKGTSEAKSRYELLVFTSFLNSTCKWVWHRYACLASDDLLPARKAMVSFSWPDVKTGICYHSEKLPTCLSLSLQGKGCPRPKIHMTYWCLRHFRIQHANSYVCLASDDLLPARRAIVSFSWQDVKTGICYQLEHLPKLPFALLAGKRGIRGQK